MNSVNSPKFCIIPAPKVAPTEPLFSSEAVFTVFSLHISILCPRTLGSSHNTRFVRPGRPGPYVTNDDLVIGEDTTGYSPAVQGASCGGVGSASRYFNFVAPVDGTFVFETFNTTFASAIAIWRQTGGGPPVDGMDGECSGSVEAVCAVSRGSRGNKIHDTVNTQAEVWAREGESLMVQVFGQTDLESGRFSLAVQQACPAAMHFATELELSNSTDPDVHVVHGNITADFPSASSPSCAAGFASSNSPSAFWKFTSPENGPDTWRFVVTGKDGFLPTLAVYALPSSTVFALCDEVVCASAGDQGAAAASLVIQGGASVVLQISSAGNPKFDNLVDAYGYSLTIERVCPPNGKAVVSLGVAGLEGVRRTDLAMSMSATSEAEQPSCDNNPGRNLVSSRFFSVVSKHSGMYAISAESEDFDTVVSVFKVYGNETSMASCLQIACNNDRKVISGNATTNSQARVVLQENEEVIVQVARALHSSAEGVFSLQVRYFCGSNVNAQIDVPVVDLGQQVGRLFEDVSTRIEDGLAVRADGIISAPAVSFSWTAPESRVYLIEVCRAMACSWSALCG